MERAMQSEVKCGLFHIVFTFMTQMARFCTVWGLYIMMFGNYEPPWTCVLEDYNDKVNERNVSDTTVFIFPSVSNKSEGLDSENTNSSGFGFQDHHNNGSFLTNNESSRTTIHGSCPIYPSCKRIVFDSDSSTIVTEFSLVCDKAWIASFIISVELFAVVPGAYIGGQIGERFGRKVSLYGSNALMTTALILAIFSYNWEMYTVTSAFIGLGGGGILSTSVVYTMEFLNPWWRAMFASIPVWNASLAIFTLVIVWLRDWRFIHAASACLSGLSVLGAFWVPESVRWLEAHGKRKEAVKVIKRIYKTNRLTLSSAKSQQSIEESDECEAAVTTTSTRTTTIVKRVSEDANIKEEEKVQLQEDDSDGHKTYLDLFRDPRIRSITLRAAVAWLCTLIAYLAMGYGVKSLAGDYYVNVIVASVSEVPMMLIIGPLANKIGRRWSAMAFLSLAAGACGAIVVVQLAAEVDNNNDGGGSGGGGGGGSDSSTKGMAIKVLALVAKALSAAAWCVLATMSIELFPTVVRNLGYGFLTLVSRTGGIMAPYLIPQDASAFAVCFSVMSAALVVSVVMTMSLPETKGKPLTNLIIAREQPGRGGGDDKSSSTLS